MIVVTTPTGKIRSQLIPHLLASEEAVRVVARDPSRLTPEVRRQVEIVTGSLEDDGVWKQALEGAESVFLVVPPSLTDDNGKAYCLRFTLRLASARPVVLLLQSDLSPVNQDKRTEPKETAMTTQRALTQ